MKAFNVVHAKISKRREEVVASQASVVPDAQSAFGSRRPGDSSGSGEVRSRVHERRGSIARKLVAMVALTHEENDSRAAGERSGINCRNGAGRKPAFIASFFNHINMS